MSASHSDVNFDGLSRTDAIAMLKKLMTAKVAPRNIVAHLGGHFEDENENDNPQPVVDALRTATAAAESATLPANTIAVSTKVESSTANDVKSLQRWLLTEGRVVQSMEDLLKGLAAQLLVRGIPVDRICGATTMVHPQTAAWDWTWESCNDPEDVVVVQYSYEDFHTYCNDKDLTLMRLYYGAPYVRFHKDHPEDISEDYRDLFVSKGYVDGYALQCTPGSQGWRSAVTWETKRLEGFTDSNIAVFDGIIATLSAIMEIHTSYISTGVLLRAYLGRDAGDRVHKGAVKRGDGTTLRSVVWFSDVRGFTRLSNTIGRDELLELLNSIFEVTVDVLEKHGGEVLKFMGDGMMGIFPDRTKEVDDPSSCCRAARAAAIELQQRIEELGKERSKKGLQFADVGIGLHFGDASYGNIGAPSRMDFTVIGSAVNLASRVEGLCGKLGASVLTTKEFATEEGGAYTARGRHTVKGVEKSIEVFQLVT